MDDRVSNPIKYVCDLCSQLISTYDPLWGDTWDEDKFMQIIAISESNSGNSIPQSMINLIRNYHKKLFYKNHPVPDRINARKSLVKQMTSLVLNLTTDTHPDVDLIETVISTLSTFCQIHWSQTNNDDNVDRKHLSICYLNYGRDFQQKLGWVMPDTQLLNTITKVVHHYFPTDCTILEVNAGYGLLSLLLRGRGLNMITTDICEIMCSGSFTDVEQLNMIDAIDQYSEQCSVLLTCWPGGSGFDSNNQHIGNAVSKFVSLASEDKPKMVIYIGENVCGCTAYPFREETDIKLTAEEYCSNDTISFAMLYKNHFTRVDDYVFVKLYT